VIKDGRYFVDPDRKWELNPLYGYRNEGFIEGVLIGHSCRVPHGPSLSLIKVAWALGDAPA
jgi:hypothetical protein